MNSYLDIDKQFFFTKFTIEKLYMLPYMINENNFIGKNLININFIT